jgi:hypothetical protein
MENITSDQIATYRRRADEFRAKANRTADLSLRLEFAREAKQLEQLAENLERVAARAIEH